MSSNTFKISPSFGGGGGEASDLTLMQDKCAMKIGTDSVLLGRWMNEGREQCCSRPLSCVPQPLRVLDIGCGTGILALMAAARFPDSIVTAIDIDEQAYQQCRENIERNGLQGRVEALHTSLQDFCPRCSIRYDMIVCNPPYFQNSLKCPDQQRNTARHTDTLDFGALVSLAAGLLAPSGTFSLVIPAEAKPDIDFHCALAALFPRRVTAVKTTPRKPVRRYLLEYSPQCGEIVTDAIVLNP